MKLCYCCYKLSVCVSVCRSKKAYRQNCASCIVHKSVLFNLLCVLIISGLDILPICLFFSPQTPKEEQLTSSDFHNGSFHLLLPNPIKGGNYSCSLSPPLSPATRCLPRHSALWTDVSVEVEEVDARFLLLEASVQAQVDERAALRVQMQEENERLLDVIGDLKNQTEVLRNRAGQY